MNSKYIKELDEKLIIDGSESVLIQDNNGTKQLNINTLINNVNNNIDLENYATKTYVNESINNIDLTSYATKTYVDSVINNQNQSANVPDIVKLNKDIEPFVIQASSGRMPKFGDKTKPLVFAHFSDIHNKQDLWNRIIEYINYYSDYINFGIHTGDICEDIQSDGKDLYANGPSCKVPVFNCVGNHDVSTGSGVNPNRKPTYNLCFRHTDNWNVNFIQDSTIAFPMSYYKDYPDQKIRIIVLNFYYDPDVHCTWLTQRLNEAKSKGYHVITFGHERTNILTTKLNTNFQTLDRFESSSLTHFDSVIGNWIKAGGKFVAHFAGHEHTDYIGYTDNGVLNICVQAATSNYWWIDGKRIANTKTYDCFNIVSVDIATGILKLVRVGNNSDHYLREKKVLCYDYINKKIISQ